MPDISGSLPGSIANPSLPTIADRVQQRLLVAGLAIDRRLRVSSLAR